MTRWLISNETPHPHPDLTRHLREAFTRAAPYVTRISGLELPPQVRLRLVTPRGLSRAHALTARTHAAHLRTSDDEAVSSRAGIFGAVAPTALGLFIRACWPAVGAATLPGTGDAPDVAFVPQALTGMRVQPSGLDVIAAHELTHVAQLHHAPHAPYEHLAAEIRTPEPEEPGTSSAHDFAAEGHATWVHRIAMEALHNDPDLPFAHAQPGGRLRSRIIRRLALAVRRGNPYTEGRAFIEAVHLGAGPDAVNLTWSDVTWAPTLHEVRHPDEWLDRYTKSTR